MKGFTRFLLSGAGVIAMLAFAVLVCLIFNALNLRVDLTEDRIHTLTPGSRNVLKGLDTPVKIRFYATRDNEIMPGELQVFARKIEDLLIAYKRASKGKVQVEKLDPKPDSKAHDSAELDGIQGVQFSEFLDPLYFGISVTCLDRKVALPPLFGNQRFGLRPMGEDLVEYRLTRAILQVTRESKPVIGLMSSLPLAGQAPPMGMPPQFAQQGSPPWFLYRQLQQDYEVRDVAADVEEIEDDLDALVLFHPGSLSEKAAYAVDQYVQGGGKLFVFVDPMSIVAQFTAPPQMRRQGMPPQNRSSDLPTLFKAWGLQFDSSQVLADMKFRTTLMGPSGQPEEQPAVLRLTDAAVNGEDPVTKRLRELIMYFPGGFTGEVAAGLKKTPLLTSSPKSQLVSSFMVQRPSSIMRSFEASGTEYDLAVRLTGKFPTAFPEGDPSKKVEEPKPDEKMGAGAVTPPVPAPPAEDVNAKPEAPDAAPKPVEPTAAGGKDSGKPEDKPADPAAAETDETPAPSPEAAPAPEPATDKPAAAAPAPDTGGEENDPAAADEKKEPTAPAKEAVVVLVADADMFYEEVLGRRTGDNGLVESNHNLAFFLNLLGQELGYADLTEARTRSSTGRPFTRIKEMEAEAEKEFLPVIEDIEKKRNEAQSKMNDIRVVMGEGGTARIVLTEDQANALEDLGKQEQEYTKKLKELNRDLRKKKQALRNRIKVLNIAAMPALVALAGLIVWIARAFKTSAK